MSFEQRAWARAQRGVRLGDDQADARRQRRRRDPAAGYAERCQVLVHRLDARRQGAHMPGPDRAGLRLRSAVRPRAGAPAVHARNRALRPKACSGRHRGRQARRLRNGAHAAPGCRRRLGRPRARQGARPLHAGAQDAPSPTLPTLHLRAPRRASSTTATRPTATRPGRPRAPTRTSSCGTTWWARRRARMCSCWRCPTSRTGRWARASPTTSSARAAPTARTISAPGWVDQLARAACMVKHDRGCSVGQGLPPDLRLFTPSLHRAAPRARGRRYVIVSISSGTDPTNRLWYMPTTLHIP